LLEKVARERVDWLGVRSNQPACDPTETPAGAVIGVLPRQARLDGTRTTQPEHSFWFRGVGPEVETFGTQPQLEVDSAPRDAFNAPNCDSQLAAAPANVLAACMRVDFAQPNWCLPPRRTVSALPERRR
jgi:tricorn protease